MKKLMKIFTICFMLMGLLFSVEHKNKLPNIKSINYNIDGMSCQKCVNKCGNSLNGIEGITSYQVDLEAGKININYNPEIVSPLQIKTALQTTPFKISEVFLTPKKIIKTNLLIKSVKNLFRF